MKKAVCMAAGILLLAAGSSQAAPLNTVFVPLQAGKVTIDTNDADKDFAVIRMREMTGLGDAVYPDALLRVKLKTHGSAPNAYLHDTVITAADINGNRLQYEDGDIKLTCNLTNELCNLVVKDTDIIEGNLPDSASNPGVTNDELKVVVRIDDTRYVHRDLWWRTDSSSQIRYTTPY